MLKQTMIGVYLLTTLISCTHNKSAEKSALEILADTTNAKKEIIEEVKESSHRFETIDSLQRYINPKLNSTIVKAISEYNAILRTNYSEEDVNIKYELSDVPWRGEFYYDFGDFQLKLGLVPKADSIGYLHQLDNEWEWESYQNTTVGFIPHELGHWIHGEIIKEKELNFGNLDSTNTVIEIYGDRIIIEGIAIWLENLITEKDELYFDKDLALGFAGYDSLIATGQEGRFVYSVGEYLVTPILNKNFEQGVILMTQNPPNCNNSEELREYQQDIYSKLD
jgi:hypothetical protein